MKESVSFIPRPFCVTSDALPYGRASVSPISRRRATTCSMSQFGVEAPAVTPTRSAPARSSGLISSGVSMRKLLAHCSLQTESSLRLFEECLPPMT